MEPERETVRAVAFVIGIIAFGLSVVLFVLDLRTMHFAMAFRMLAPAILQGFSLFLFRDSLALRPGKERRPTNSAHVSEVG